MSNLTILKRAECWPGVGGIQRGYGDLPVQA